MRLYCLLRPFKASDGQPNVYAHYGAVVGLAFWAVLIKAYKGFLNTADKVQPATCLRGHSQR